MALEEGIKADREPLAAAPTVSRRQLAMFVANRAIALGWALKGSCKPCAHRLFMTARWLVPEAQRFLVHRTGLHNPNQPIIEYAINLGKLLSRIQPRVVGGFLIVLAFLGSLDLALRTTATGTQPLIQNSAFQHETQIPAESKIISVSKTSEPMQEVVLETASLSKTQIPLPLRKPERVFKARNGKTAKVNSTPQKRMAQQKRALPKLMR